LETKGEQIVQIILNNQQ